MTQIPGHTSAIANMRANRELRSLRLWKYWRRNLLLVIPSSDVVSPGLIVSLWVALDGARQHGAKSNHKACVQRG